MGSKQTKHMPTNALCCQSQRQQGRHAESKKWLRVATRSLLVSRFDQAQRPAWSACSHALKFQRAASPFAFLRIDEACGAMFSGLRRAAGDFLGFAALPAGERLSTGSVSAEERRAAARA